MFGNQSDNALIILVNAAGVGVAYFMLGLSIWLAPVDLSTQGYWGIGVLLLTLALVNFVKYRFDARIAKDRLQQLETAKNEKILKDFVASDAA